MTSHHRRALLAALALGLLIAMLGFGRVRAAEEPHSGTVLETPVIGIVGVTA